MPSRRWQLGQELSLITLLCPLHQRFTAISGCKTRFCGIWDSDCWHKQVHFCRFVIPLSLIQVNLWPQCLIGELLHWIILPWRGLATAKPIHLDDCRREHSEERGWCSCGEGSTQRGSLLPAMAWTESGTGAKRGGERGEETADPPLRRSQGQSVVLAFFPAPCDLIALKCLLLPH